MMFDRIRIRRSRGSFITMLAALAPATACLGGIPSNDTCSGAFEVDLGETPFNSIGATATTPAMCVTIGADVWFTYHSTFTGPLRIDTCGNADFDTVIAAYSGCGCGSYNLLACNDDGANCSDHTSKITINVQAGSCYRIRVAGHNGESGTGILTLTPADPLNAASADRIETGADPGDRLGWVVAEGGKMNNDSLDEVIVGAYLNDTLGADTGRAYVLRGSTLNSLYTLTGDAAGDHFGAAVAHCDVNADGREDIIIGAPTNDSGGGDAGHVYVYSGFDGSLLWERDGFAAGDKFGYAVARAGDVNNDGFDDVIVGAPYNDAGGVDAGRAYVLDGEDGSVLRTVTGTQAGSLFGSAVSTATDLDDDDKDDFMVGAPRHDVGGEDAGRVSIYSGADGSALIKLNGDKPGDRFGSSLAAASFHQGFDYSFLAIGSPNNDAAGTNAGRIKVYFRNHDNPGEGGCNKLVCVKWTINGGNPGDRLGTSVDLRDLKGNNYPEIIVGAPQADLNGSNSGAAYLFDGSNGTLWGKFFGEAPGDYFGQAVAAAGDVNGDGDDDLVVGAPYNGAGGAKAGRAYVFFLDDGVSNMVASPSPAPAAEGGDLNADGAVTADDLSNLLAAWGPCPQTPCPADLDGDGDVNVDDLFRLLTAWSN